MKLALHHVEEDGDGGFTQLRLRDECHLQDRADHLGNELDLVLPCSRETHASVRTHEEERTQPRPLEFEKRGQEGCPHLQC